MATTRIMPLHVGKGRTESRAIVNYAKTREVYVAYRKAGYCSYDTAVHWNIGTCSCSLALVVVI